MINSLVSLLVGGYILTVIGLGKGPEFLALIKQEKGFIRWLVAIIIVMTVAKYDKRIFAPLVTIVFVAMLLEAQNKGQIKTFLNDFNSLMGYSK